MAAFYQNAYLCLNCAQTAIACTFCTALCATCCAANTNVGGRRRGVNGNPTFASSETGRMPLLPGHNSVMERC